MEVNLEQLIPTPLRPIKQVELWKKWALLIPEKYRAGTCPKPTDAIINSIKEQNREKSKNRTKQKRLQNANEISDKNSEKPLGRMLMNFYKFSYPSCVLICQNLQIAFSQNEKKRLYVIQKFIFILPVLLFFVM